MDYERLIKWLREFEGPGSSGTNEAADAIEDIWADFSKALEKLAESRARFADSEARRAELEAVVARVYKMAHEDDAKGWDSHQALVQLVCDPDEGLPVLEDRDRENRAVGWDEGVKTAYPMIPRPDWADAPTNPYRGDNR